jgi:hypothetical protein
LDSDNDDVDDDFICFCAVLPEIAFKSFSFCSANFKISSNVNFGFGFDGKFFVSFFVDVEGFDA